IAYVRPQRYTKEFMDREELFTLSAFDPSYKKALGYLGSHSGRDGDKIQEAGLTPLFIDGTTAFEEAKLVFVCKKLYHARLQEQGFTDPAIVKESYADKAFHEAYYGEIVDVFVRD
ncbi:MAG: flavin reductase family protein, partial [Christensenellaceae bacterium]